jgi:hypothetical protein
MHLVEGLRHRDLVGIVKPTIHIDEFASKMGDDADIVVASFYVRDETAAEDLVNWFEKGYNFVLDADRSPGQIKTNRYLVYVELYRRSKTADNIAELLDDLATLTEFKLEDWTMRYKQRSSPFSIEEFNKAVITNPDEYRLYQDGGLNEMRERAGIAPRQLHKRASDILALQALARI